MFGITHLIDRATWFLAQAGALPYEPAGRRNLQSAPNFPYQPIYTANNEQLLFNEVSSHLQHMGFTGNLQNKEQDIFSVVVDILRNKNIPEQNIHTLANNITFNYLHQQFSRTYHHQTPYVPPVFPAFPLTQPHINNFIPQLPFPYSASLSLGENYQNLFNFYMGQNQANISQMQQNGMSEAQIASHLNHQSMRNMNATHSMQQAERRNLEMQRRANMRDDDYRHNHHDYDGDGHYDNY